MLGTGHSEQPAHSRPRQDPILPHDQHKHKDREHNAQTPRGLPDFLSETFDIERLGGIHEENHNDGQAIMAIHRNTSAHVRHPRLRRRRPAPMNRNATIFSDAGTRVVLPITAS